MLQIKRFLHARCAHSKKELFMSRSWVIRGLFGCLLGFAANRASFGQTAPTTDVLAPRPDIGAVGLVDVPTLRNDISLPDVQFLFDQVLDPQRVSVIETIGKTSVNDLRLTAGARSVILNHLVAMQQVELAIRFLQANRSEILSGNNAPFNRVFGNIGTEREIAVISPSPLGGNATIMQPAAANNQGTSLITITFQQQGGGNNQQGQVINSVTGGVRAGDFVYIAPAVDFLDADNPVDISTLGGVVAKVFAVLSTSSGGGGGATNQPRILLDPNTPPIPRTAFGGQAGNQLQVYRVLRFEKRVDSTRYEQVLATFESIRSVLGGLDPALPSLGQIPATLQYNRAFTDIGTVWQPGVAPFAPLNQTISSFMNTGVIGLNSTRGADRLVRQSGFSTSDSHSHLDRQEDRANNLTTDRLRRATTPLLWTEDNDLPLTFDTRLTVNGATNDDRPFFRDRQTIFGEPDNVYTQYLGRAFFEETINHAGGFFDDFSNAIDDTLQMAQRRQRSPAGGTVQTQAVSTAGGVVQQDVLELANVPESGTATVTNTEFRRWQMIIESFAEFSSDLTQFDVAAVGIASIFGGAAPGDLAAKDAGNYARFAGLLGSAAVNAIDVNRIEPFGKRVDGGFNPVVPRD